MPAPDLKPKMWIRKSTNHSNKNMWVGDCDCGHRMQYWTWGATLGAMLHHY